VKADHTILFAIADSRILHNHKNWAMNHGINAVSSLSGMHALHLFEKNSPTIVISMGDMEDMAGDEIINLIRESNPAHDDPLIIFFQNGKSEDYDIEGLKKKGVMIAPKQENFQLLTKIIDNYIEMKKNAKAKRKSMGVTSKAD
jgi:DNA-binding response OmpR family regulator